MTINILNWDILSKYSKNFPFSLERLEEIYAKNFLEDNEVNLVFTSPREIKKLNSEFRNKKDVTDVLSFNINEQSILGEIYICPKYVKKNIEKEKYNEEILRLIVHGTLHLLGQDHEGKFNESNPDSEPMFVKQEEILENILKEIN
jgi:probable rRNA maturation factor